jgi:hypothetical protein
MLTLNTPLKDIKTDNVWLSKLIYSEVVEQDCYKLRKLMKLFTPQVMFDIGINVGITSLLAKQLWPHVQIIGFEVNKHTAACASLNLPNTDIEVAEVGYQYRAIPLVERFGYPDLLKIDCEGGEVPFFYDLVPENRLEYFQVIVGEWHQWPARALLESAFKDMFFTKFNDALPEIGPWHTFYAIRKTMPNAEDLFKIVCE